MFNKFFLIFVLFIPVLLSSCSSISPYTLEIRQGNYIAPEARLKIKTGMSRQQVTATLGSPLINDVFHANRWDYIYRFEEKKVLKEQQRFTVFFDGNFVSRIDDSELGSGKPAEASLTAPSSK
jgi:outer membrane protein assembly factor BamE